MQVKKLNNLALYQKAIEIQAIGTEAVNEVKEENRRLGIPIVFSRNGKIFYEMPDGNITDKSPFKSKS